MYEFETSPTVSIHDLKVSKPFVYRPDTIEVYSKATDYQDHEKDLLPHFEYITPEHTGWQTELLSEPEYKNDRWQSTFTIPVNATLGYYGFRVRYNDTVDMWSRWCYLNGSLRVLNNPPQMNNIDLSKSIAVIGEKLELAVKGTDIEDELNELTFKPEYKHSESQFWDPLEFYQMELNDSRYDFTFSVAPGMPYGFYDFRVMVNDTDNDYSGWMYLNRSLYIGHAPPEILSINLSRHEIYRTEALEIYVNCSDVDSIIDDLFVELQYTHSAGSNWRELSAYYYETRWEAYLLSKKSWETGMYNFRARVSDMEANICPWFYLNDSLMVMNNVPYIMGVYNIPSQMNRGENINISMDAKDKENAEEALKIEMEYKVADGKDWFLTYLTKPIYTDGSWHIDFVVPTNAATGVYSFRMRTGDLDDAWSDYLYKNNTLNVTNNLPNVISFDQNPKEVYRTEVIYITTTGMDVETHKMDLECNIFYLAPDSDNWQDVTVEFDLSSMSWQSELVTTKTFVPGNYSFKVLFSDATGDLSLPVYANHSVWVQNNPPMISEDLDDIHVGTDQLTLSLTDYGYDIETSKGDLIWSVDIASVDRRLFQVKTGNVGEQKLVIDPVPSKTGRDDITIILSDGDFGHAIKTNLTITIDSRTESEKTPEEEDSAMAKFTSNSSLLFIYVLIIIVIIIVILFGLYRRKKRKEEVKEDEVPKAEEQEKLLQPTVASPTPLPEAPLTEPTPVIEQPSTPTPVPIPVEAVAVPMPVEAPKPQLPAATEIPMAEPAPLQPTAESQPVAQVQTEEPKSASEVTETKQEIEDVEKN
jgi:hypothetical protein